MLTMESTGTATIAHFARLFPMVRGWVEGTVATLTPEQATWQPAGLALPAGAQYAHILTSEDFLLHGAARGGAPLAMSTWQGRTGISELPPAGAWDDWARWVVVDLPAARAYGQAVYAATDAYLASATDDDLAREVDLSAIGVGFKTVAEILDLLLVNAAAHCGEISCLKGLQGAQGYPF